MPASRREASRPWPPSMAWAHELQVPSATLPLTPPTLLAAPAAAAPAALLVIFRQNAGYGRFHEGRIRLQAMTAAYLEACTDVRECGGRGPRAGEGRDVSVWRTAAQKCARGPAASSCCGLKCPGTSPILALPPNHLALPLQALTFDGGSKTFAPPDAASMRFRLDCIHTFRWDCVCCFPVSPPIECVGSAAVLCHAAEKSRKESAVPPSTARLPAAPPPSPPQPAARPLPPVLALRLAAGEPD